MTPPAQLLAVCYLSVCQCWQTTFRAHVRSSPGRERGRSTTATSVAARGAILLVAATVLTACGGGTPFSDVFSLPTPSPALAAISDPTSSSTVEGATASPPSTATATTSPTPEHTATATLSPKPTNVPTPAPTLEPVLSVHVSPELPIPFGEAVHELAAQLPDQVSIAGSADEADVRVVLGQAGGEDPAGFAVYAVVAPFPTVEDEVGWTDVVAAWNGTPQGPFSGSPLLVAADTAQALTTRLGPPGSGGVQIVTDEDLVTLAWHFRPSWAIVPFDGLEPRWKVLRLDGISVLDKQFDPSSYPLTLMVSLEGEPKKTAALWQLLDGHLTNREADRITIVAMTGVTALARGTAMRMDRYGIGYPAEEIWSWLTEPDITHISSEVSFAHDCPPPADYVTTVFCSDPSYIELIDILDIDIIELTGNHLLDWGQGAMDLSLRLYDERGIPYFGGGWTLAQARSPVTMTAGMHTFAFLGCNPVGPKSDWATDSSAGSASCDYAAMLDDIRRLRADGLIPIVTLQYLESYQYEPLERQRIDFGALAEAGAAIVSGSQAHQPQGFSFEYGSFIHYGLGNLFFDQMWSLETRQEFVDWHVFYDGRHISTEILTAMLEDYARPRPMTVSERESLLRATFNASGW